MVFVLNVMEQVLYSKMSFCNLDFASLAKFKTI